jgi:PBP1b-binding outer membrane lipoprotein LpoB
MLKTAVIIMLAAALLVGCGSSRQVTRLDPGQVTDLSGKWNDTDAKLVAEEMVSDCLGRPWLSDFLIEKSKKPVVTVGQIRNKSSEHIERDDVREERLEQRDWASEETVKKLRQETGADFILLGAIKSITDQLEGETVVFYQTDLELINVETNVKSWIGTKKIKKGISQSGSKW